MADKRTSLILSDDRQRLIDQAETIVQRDDADDVPLSKLFDAALTNLIESRENVEDYRERLQHGQTQIPPGEAKQLLNTSIVRLTYRTGIETGR